MKAEIKKDYGVFGVHEISVDWNGFNFLVIYGKHAGGWFVAIPNWKKCVESAEPSDYQHNAKKLSSSFDDTDMGEALATAIKEHWEGLRNG